MKRVLVITSFFPPAGGIAPNRMASFVRHLPASGWDPSVVTIDWHEGNRKWIDRSQNEAMLREKVIFRSVQPDLRRKPGSLLPPLLRWEALKLDPVAVLQQVSDRFRYGESSMGSRFFVRGALRFLRAHLRENRYDAILATSPDLNPFIIAGEVGKRFEIPWVADCRDDYAVYKEGKPGYVRMEKKLLATAAALVTVSQGVADEIGRRLGRRVEVVENGFEPEEGNEQGSLDPPFEAGILNLVYTGTVSTYYPNRHNPDLLFAAVNLFLERNPSAEGRLAMHIFGDPELQPIIDEFSLKYPRLRGLIRDHGRVERRVAMLAQRSADLLLILAHPGRKGILTGKVFEYLAARRPILCLPGDGDALDDLLGRTKAGVVLQSAEEGAAFLERSFAQWEDRGKLDYECEEEEVAQFSRVRLTARLAKVLDGVCAGRAAARRDR